MMYGTQVGGCTQTVVLGAAGVRLGKTYPLPIIDHAAGRARALAAYEVARAP